MREVNVFVFGDEDAPPSIVWLALTQLYGHGIASWEPDTFRIELQRKGIEPNDALMAKVLGAQTVLTTNAWTTNHDVLYAFALACAGLPADAGAFIHPTPEQLAWALNEVAALTGHVPDEDEGTDPDAVDPALAAVLHDEGWVLAPKELAFVQPVLDRMNQGEHVSAERVQKAWEKLVTENDPGSLRRKMSDLEDDALGVQLKRLYDCREYVTAKASTRLRYRGGR
jgi:hypothetical protein